MADKKKEEQTLDAVQAQAGAEGTANASDGYSAAGLNSRKDVEDALTNASYKPGQSVTDAAQALKEWQANRPKDYQSNYQEKIDQLLDQLLQRRASSTATRRTRSTASMSRPTCRTPATPAPTRRHRPQP